MSKNWKVRKPYQKEYVEVAQCLMIDDEERDILKLMLRPLTLEKVVEYLKGYYVTVIDNYVSDSQGYAGQIFTIIWGSPEFRTTIIRNAQTNKLEVERSREKR